MDTSPFKVRSAVLDEMRMWPRNPKDHDIGALMESFSKFGYVAPILVNSQNGAILAGHGRLKSLADMKREDLAPPGRVTVDKDGEWVVPYIEVDVDEDLHEAYVVADNRLTELGGWDWGILPSVLADLHEKGMLEVTGFDTADLDTMSRWAEGEGYPGAKEYDESVAGEVEMGSCPQCSCEFPLGHARRKWLDDQSE